MLRKVWVWVLVVGLLTGSMATMAVAKKYNVAVLLPGAVEFFSVERKGMNKAAAKYGLNLIYADAEWDAGKQLSQVENFIARKVDLILLCAADNMALRAAVPLCQKAKIPLITFTNSIGRNPTGVYPGVISHVGRSEVQSGILQGKMAEMLFGNKPINIVLIEGNPGTTPQRFREKGFMEVAKRHPNWKIVAKRPIDGWTKEGALSFMEAFLQSGKKVDLVSCQWWSGAIAAAMALKERHIKNVKVTGLEFAKELVPYLKSGEVAATTYFSVEGEGYKAVETAAEYLNGKKVPKFVEIKQVIVTKENVDKFVPEL